MFFSTLAFSRMVKMRKASTALMRDFRKLNRMISGRYETTAETGCPMKIGVTIRFAGIITAVTATMPIPRYRGRW